MSVACRGSAIETNCIAHRHDGVLIAELELREGAHSIEPLNVDAHIRIPLGRMALAADILELSRLAAAEIHKLTGFDRVMLYRFDEEWNGEVIAEVAALRRSRISVCAFRPVISHRRHVSYSSQIPCGPLPMSLPIRNQSFLRLCHRLEDLWI
jgi:hypothetical protein